MGDLVIPVNGITEIADKALCPACFAAGMPLEIWLDNRIVDVHRSHIRKLCRVLGLQTIDDIEQLIDIGHGISITDNWWIQKSEEELDYNSLKQYNEELADIAIYLMGLSEMLGFDLEEEILKKVDKNGKRVYNNVDGVNIRVSD